MASSTKMAFVLFFACSFFIQGTLGEIVCEELPNGMCAYSIASSGKRCLLENYANKDGKVELLCSTSEVVVQNFVEYIESDECVNACGVDRIALGISSDGLFDSEITAKLCGPSCYEKCSNIIDLYFKLAAGEGVFLPDLCKRVKSNPRRAMFELLSNSVASSIPDVDVAAPALSPTSF